MTDVKKTNGFEADGYYRVEYSYSVEHKNLSGLKKLREQWLAEKQREADWTPVRKEFEAKEQALNEERSNIYRSHDGPKAEQFSATGQEFSKLTSAERQAYDAALAESSARRQAALTENEQKLDALKRAWHQERSKVPPAHLVGIEGNAVFAYISQGCSQAGRKLVEGLFESHRDIVGASQNKGDWFNEHEAKMNGSIGMRKTENGWRALSEAL